MQGKSDANVELLDAAAVCGHLVPAGSVHAFLAEHRQRLFPDDLSADLFPSSRGRPSVPADVIATVMVLQALEGLSDREAIEHLRMGIAWKVAAGRPLADEGFHPTVLTLWRNKLRDSERPERIFDAVRAVVAETGVLKGKTRRALDSTVLDDAVATQDTVTQLIAAIRRVRRLVPAAAALELAGATRAELRAAGHDAVIKPQPLPRAVAGGFDRDDFVVDHRNRTVTCPAGHTVKIAPKGGATFGTRCRGCPLRAQCTTAKGGKILHIREHDAELVYGRQAWADPILQQHYRQHRPMVERTIAWVVAGGNRRVRYRGVKRNQQWLTTRITALNLRRLLNLGLHRAETGWAIA